MKTHIMNTKNLKHPVLNKKRLWWETKLIDISSTVLFISVINMAQKPTLASVMPTRGLCSKCHLLLCSNKSHFSHSKTSSTPSDVFCSLQLVPHLWHEEVTRGQLLARLLHLALTLNLQVFQMAAALHHGFHLWLYLTNVEASHGELLLDRTGDLHGLEIDESERRWDEFESGGDVWLRLSEDNLKKDEASRRIALCHLKHTSIRLTAQFSRCGVLNLTVGEGLYIHTSKATSIIQLRQMIWCPCLQA